MGGIVLALRVAESSEYDPCNVVWMGHTIGEAKRPYHCLRAYSQTGMDISASTFSQLRKNRIKCK